MKGACLATIHPRPPARDEPPMSRQPGATIQCLIHHSPQVRGPAEQPPVHGAGFRKAVLVPRPPHVG